MLPRGCHWRGLWPASVLARPPSCFSTGGPEPPPVAPTARAHYAAALVAVVLLGATTSEDAAVLEQRRHAIEMLSQTELNQLKRNYEKYLKLSPDAPCAVNKFAR